MEYITMSAREMDRFGVITRLLQGETTAREVSEQLHLSVRQIKRIKKRVEKQGPEGLVHKSRGKESKRKIKPEVEKHIVDLLSKTYKGFGPTLAAEKLSTIEKITVSDEALRTLMVNHDLWKPRHRKTNKEHREWRPRKENYGAMEQYDGSYHKWFEDRAEECCLLLSVDDATGKMTQAVFDRHEGILPTFGFWKSYVKEIGKPSTIYLDKFSTYKINHKSAEDNSDMMTQFQRACQDLGITLIFAHSPESKGRVERMFQTLQDRLVKELRLQNISDIETANIFLKEKYMPSFNDRFSVVPTEHADIHRPLTAIDTKQLESIFSIHSKRVVANDFTVKFKNQYFQLAEQQLLTVLRKDKVLIEEQMDGSVHLKLRGKELTYTVLPKRPEKVSKMKITALVTSKNNYKPRQNHPWRHQIFGKQINLQTA